ncbi:hypothetical protein A2548_00070 [candidate division WOR-1 bacterium RIFOXYD2_FULL_41_8]|nr:MAG: hypothetical protein A2548_00070 [candidate division WOR-1 bacterium RIFOXYD2_FULL_41_8]
MMMIILQLLICIAAPIVLGLAILTLIFDRDNPSFLEKLGLSFGLGLGLITLIMASTNLANSQTNFIIILSILAIIVIPIFVWQKAKLKPSLAEKPTKTKNRLVLSELILVSLITIKVGYVFFEALIKPVVSFDAFWRHSLVAKAVFFDKTFNTPFTTNLIAENPPFVSFSQAYIYFGLNSWNEMLGKIVFPLLFLSLLIVFYCNLRKYISRLSALLFTFLLSSLPFLVYHASTAYADFSQTYFYSIGTMYLFAFITSKGKALSSLIISAIFLGLGVFAKKHGIYLAGIDGLILVIFLGLRKEQDWPTRLNSLLLYIVIIMTLTGPWIFLNSSFLSSIGSTVSLPFSQAEVITQANLPTISERITQGTPLFLERMFFFGNWHLVWVLFLLSSIFFWKKIFSSSLAYLFALTILNLLYVFLAVTLIGAYEFLLNGTLLNRLMMFQSPIIIFFCGLIIKDK